MKYTGQIIEVSDSPLRRVIRELGGWPVTDPDWKPENTLPLEKVLGILKRNFTLGVLIEEWIGPDDRDSKSHIVQVPDIHITKRDELEYTLIVKTLDWPDAIGPAQ